MNKVIRATALVSAATAFALAGCGNDDAGTFYEAAQISESITQGNNETLEHGVRVDNMGTICEYVEYSYNSNTNIDADSVILRELKNTAAKQGVSDLRSAMVAQGVTKQNGDHAYRLDVLCGLAPVKKKHPETVEAAFAKLANQSSHRPK